MDTPGLQIYMSIVAKKKYKWLHMYNLCWLLNGEWYLTLCLSVWGGKRKWWQTSSPRL